MTQNPHSKPPKMRTRSAILMAADMVGYSLLMDRDETQAISVIRELRNEYLEPVVLNHGGEVLKRMGDGWIFAFTSADDQIRCAMEVQSSLSEHDLVKLRIGAHIGEIQEDEHDFYGAGVNLAQRLQTEAPPGGIMISQDLHLKLSSQLQEQFRDAGSFRLKNIVQLVNGFQWRPPFHLASGTEGTRQAANDVPTVAVEPFEFSPDEAEPRAVAADLCDQIIMRLSRRTGIRVLDEGSQGFRDAVYVLQGRLRVSRDRGRLSLKFVLSGEGRTVWSQLYEGDTSDIFRFSDELIERADSDLRLQINAFDGERIAHLPDDVLSISELRSRAASVIYQTTAESYERACRLLDQALRLNPSDPMALAMRAEGIISLAAARHAQLEETELRRLETDLDQAVEAAPRSDYIFCMRSLFRTNLKRDVDGAIADARRALSLSPAYATGHESMGLAYLLSGNYSDASEHLQKAVELSEADPFLPARLFQLAIGYHFLEARPEALAAIGRAIQLGPRQRSFHLLRAECCRAAGDGVGAEKSDALAARLEKAPSVLAERPALPDAHQAFADLFAPGS